MESISKYWYVANLFLKFDVIETNFILTAPPSYDESQYRGNIVDKNDSEHTRLVGDQTTFAPRYPVYAAFPAFTKN